MRSDDSVSMIFQLTTSHRGRHYSVYRSQLRKYFNSLPHTEVDVVQTVLCSVRFHFNSLPHTEVDAYLSGNCRKNGHFNSLPHTEVDGEARIILETRYKNFNSLPHTEVDHMFFLYPDRPRYFNSLPHTEVDKVTDTTSGYLNISTHYLTQR